MHNGRSTIARIVTSPNRGRFTFICLHPLKILHNNTIQDFKLKKQSKLRIIVCYQLWIVILYVPWNKWNKTGMQSLIHINFKTDIRVEICKLNNWKASDLSSYNWQYCTPNHRYGCINIPYIPVNQLWQTLQLAASQTLWTWRRRVTPEMQMLLQ